MRGDLTPEQTRLLEAIMRPEAGPAEQTAGAIADATGLTASEVHRAIRELKAMDPPLLMEEVDARLGERFWMATIDVDGEE